MAESQRPYAPLTAAADRGPTRYFHGRKKILDDFAELAKRAIHSNSGTTFLIQGAPGVGKTALLYECEKRAKAHEWEVANIGVGALWDPNKLLTSLGLGEKYKGIERSTQIGFKNFLGWGFKSMRPQPAVKNILEEGNNPLLLILDEAHGLGEDGIPPSEHKEDARTILEFIHNGKLERPVILLAAGLGTSITSFGALGISRFAEDCFVELRALGKESERAVIQDWIIKEGGAKGDPTAWIDAIAQETHGWPRHVHAYSKHASNQLQVSDGVMTPEGLHAVLEAGHEGRKMYYKQRLVDFRGDEVICLSESIADIDVGMPFNKELVDVPLIKKYGRDGADELFQKFLENGVIATDGFLYSIPIPSMHDWMRSELARTQERTRPQEKI